LVPREEANRIGPRTRPGRRRLGMTLLMVGEDRPSVGSAARPSHSAVLSGMCRITERPRQLVPAPSPLRRRGDDLQSQLWSQFGLVSAGSSQTGGMPRPAERHLIGPARTPAFPPRHTQVPVRASGDVAVSCRPRLRSTPAGSGEMRAEPGEASTPVHGSEGLCAAPGTARPRPGLPAGMRRRVWARSNDRRPRPWRRPGCLPELRS
jgi:hypothetical protein